MMICLVLSSIGTFCLQFTPTGPGAFYWLAAVSFISSTIGSGCGPLLDSTAIYVSAHAIPPSHLISRDASDRITCVFRRSASTTFRFPTTASSGSGAPSAGA